MSRSHRGFIIFILLMLSVMSFNVIIDEIHNKQMVAVGGGWGAGGSRGSRGVRSGARPLREAVSPTDPLPPVSPLGGTKVKSQHGVRWAGLSVYLEDRRLCIIL